MRDRNGAARVQVALSCEQCGARNYKTTKPRRDGQKPLALKKHCKHCNAHTLHRETK
ncbi:MAG: 50S ribosomal protein L33 [Myxococcales bacterium]|nr:50S ribosomal protein L33 [Myxococcales bacterium]MCB9579762.1 50S ribosomal protein L33 [Polyangiaceae bacterium]